MSTYLSIDRMSQSMARTLRAEGKSPATVDSYCLSARLLDEFLEARGEPRTVNVTRDAIRDFLYEQGTRRKLPSGRMGGSPGTALVRYKSLQQFFKHCVNEDELESNPMAKMEPPSVPDKPPAIVPDDVLEKLLKSRKAKTVQALRDTALLRMFLDTGCRRGEVVGMTLADLDLDGQTVVVKGKGSHIRVAVFGHKTAQALDRYLRAVEKERPAWLANKDAGLWMGQQGRLQVSGVEDVLHKMCDDAGVPRLHWHQLRHTWAHSMMSAGASEGELMTLGGWKSRTMLDVYGRSNRAERAVATAKRLSIGDRV